MRRLVPARPRLRRAESRDERFYAAAEQYGRSRDSLSVSLFGAAPDKDFLRQCEDAGVTRALFTLPTEGRDTVLPMLDDLAKLLD